MHPTLCTLTPRDRVTKPMIGSPCMGLQQRAMLVSRSPTPSTEMPEVGLDREVEPRSFGIQAASAISSLRNWVNRADRAESLSSPEPRAASRSSMLS